MATANRIFGRERPIAQLAIGGSMRADVESWLTGEGLSFTNIAIDAFGFPNGSDVLGSEVIVLWLDRETLVTEPLRLLAALTELGARAPTIAILDVEMVDVLPPFLDVEQTEFIAWPCEKDLFMSVLQHIGPTSLRERDASPINAMMMRDEVDRIAKALAALVDGSVTDPAPRAGRSAQESARLIRAIIRRRRVRAQFFPADLFADPAWDILLDLAAARFESTRVSISSLCIAASVPTTTALRWIKGMTGAGILEREADPEDGRRSFIRLTDNVVVAMEKYLTLVDEGVV